MRKILLSALLTSLLVACVPAAIPAPVSNDKLAEILARGTLVIATDAAYFLQSKLIENSIPSAGTKCSRLNILQINLPVLTWMLP